MNTVFVFDTETNGMPQWKKPSDDPSQPHIVQVAGMLVDIDARKGISAIDVIIKPDGWTIDQDMTDIHGITTEHAMDVGIPEHVAADMVHELTRNRTRVAYNTTFDNRIIRIALKRFFGNDRADEWKAGDYECAMRLAQKVIGGKQPKLIVAYKHFTGKELEGAHAAMADTVAAMEVYFACKAQLPAEPTPAPAPKVHKAAAQANVPQNDLEF